MRIILYLSILTLIFSCSENQPINNQTREEKFSESLIKGILSRMYEYDRTKPDLLNDSSLFSSEIVELNEKCKLVTLRDRERIAGSAYPTDKPLLREGSSVTSLYEGATDFKIMKITVDGQQTKVVVEVSNENEDEIFQWTDQVILIDENGLKIDDIIFDKKVNSNNSSSLKEFLTDFSEQVIE